MKNLKNHTLLYDKDCPMCEVYSNAFIKCGMLEKDGRENFSDMSEKNEMNIDYERAKNEIALINQNNNEVSYGLDSLLVIIGNSFPLLEKVGRLKPVYWFFKKFYSFISYNRKVIVPSSKLNTAKSCVPSFNLKYRLLYIGFVLLFSTLILGFYNEKLFPFFHNNFELEFFICCMQIVWQSLFLSFYLKEKVWDYLGNMMTVSLLGTLLLIPILFFKFDQIFYFIYFGMVVFIMFLEHFRRCEILRIGIIPTISWMLFRIIFGAILLFIVSSI